MTSPNQTTETFDQLEQSYANNVGLEMSVWDLKILFGQLQQHGGKSHVDWHSAVAIPWMQAKIISYFIQVNVALYESAYGKISVPKDIRPPMPEPTDERLKELHDVLKDLHAKMFGSVAS